MLYWAKSAGFVGTCCRSDCIGESHRLPCAGHSCFQPAKQHTKWIHHTPKLEPIRGAQDTSLKMFKKGQWLPVTRGDTQAETGEMLEERCPSRDKQCCWSRAREVQEQKRYPRRVRKHQSRMGETPEETEGVPEELLD